MLQSGTEALNLRKRRLAEAVTGQGGVREPLRRIARRRHGTCGGDCCTGRLSQPNLSSAGCKGERLLHHVVRRKRRNFLGKRVSLDVPSPPRAMLRTCELNDFVCWAVDEVQDHDPDYLPLLHSTLHNLTVHGADPAPVGPQATLPIVCSVAEPAPNNRSHCQPMVSADAQSLGGHDPRARSTGQPAQLPQDIDALVNEELEDL